MNETGKQKKKWGMRAFLVVVLGLVAYFGIHKYRAMHRGDAAREQVAALTKTDQLRDGDVIFQTSLSQQSLAIERATHSAYTHCGLVVRRNHEYVVLEAARTVCLTPLDAWIARGKGGRFVVKRYEENGQTLDSAQLVLMNLVGKSMMGKAYDTGFNWSDDRIYCSELVWKIYNSGAGIQLCKTGQLRDFDLSAPEVSTLMQQRYGSQIPYDEEVVAPVSLFESPKLRTVVAN